MSPATSPLEWGCDTILTRDSIGVLPGPEPSLVLRKSAK
jgi:hypothetical protein